MEIIPFITEKDTGKWAFKIRCICRIKIIMIVFISRYEYNRTFVFLLKQKPVWKSEWYPSVYNSSPLMLLLCQFFFQRFPLFRTWVRFLVLSIMLVSSVTMASCSSIFKPLASQHVLTVVTQIYVWNTLPGEWILLRRSYSSWGRIITYCMFFWLNVCKTYTQKLARVRQLLFIQRQPSPRNQFVLVYYHLQSAHYSPIQLSANQSWFFAPAAHPVELFWK